MYNTCYTVYTLSSEVLCFIFSLLESLYIELDWKTGIIVSQTTRWWYRPKSQAYSLTSESTCAKTLMVYWLSASLNPILFSFIFLWALFSFIGEWLFPDYEREECLPLKLVNFISYSFHSRRRLFFSFMPANAEVGGKQGSRVGRRGGRKEDKENVKSVLIQLVWGKYYPS